MSVNFYNEHGSMVGTDGHETAFCVVGVPFEYWPCTWYKKARTVTIDTKASIRDGCDWYFVVHIPIPPNNPKAWVDIPKVIAGSGSKPFLTVHSVTSGGDALATAALGFVGLNSNCWAAGTSLPSGATIAPSSVKTELTWGDWAGAAAGLLVDNVIGVIFDQGTGRLASRFGSELKRDIAQGVMQHVLRRLSDILNWAKVPVVPDVVDPAGKAKQLVQQRVDQMIADAGIE